MFTIHDTLPLMEEESNNSLTVDTVSIPARLSPIFFHSYSFHPADDVDRPAFLQQINKEIVSRIPTLYIYGQSIDTV